MKQIQVEYFALFRELAGTAKEPINTEAADARELFNQLQQRHSGLESLPAMKVAINDELCDWSSPIADGDRVLLFPPVAGG